jgi:anti-sigma factor RsiW
MSELGQRERPDCGTDIAAYVLGALEPAEIEALRDHLVTCAVCRDELSALQGVADTLPLAAPQMVAPRGLKRQLMANVRREARDAPAARSRRPSWARPAAALVGAFAVATAVVVALVLASGGSSGARVVQASVTTPGVSAAVHLSGGQASLVVQHMPQPPAGKIYEVWLQRGQAAPAPTNALFGVSSHGEAAVAVPGDLRGVTAVLVTPERRGGSLVPTHQPVIVAHI